MLEATIAEATVADAADVAMVRRLLVADARGIEPGELDADFCAANDAFIAAGLADGSYRAWLARDTSAEVVGGVALVLSAAPPLPGELRTTEGWVIATWVHDSHRSRGLGRALMAELEAAAAQAGVRRLFLFATDDGRPLYESMGFTARDDLFLKALDDAEPTP